LTPQASAVTALDGLWEQTTAEREGSRRALPAKIRVLVLEDDQVLLDLIHTALYPYVEECVTVKNLTEFEEALHLGSYDVASIDWQFEAGELGSQALSLLGDDREIGKVIFTNYASEPAVQNEAAYWGVDFIVEKRGINNEEYVRAVREAARLCALRRISNRLRHLGRLTGAPGEGRPEELSDEAERMLISEARAAVVSSFWERKEDMGLMNLLKRHGEWQSLEASHYAKKPFHAKLAELLRYVGMTPEELARILGVETDVAHAILMGEEDPPVDEETQRRIYQLASILSYVLRVARNEPELMHEVWTKKDLHRDSSDPPPWEPLGLRDYLKTEVDDGLEKALTWVRKY
jgi:CheY-like chemotaxis protein